MLSLSQLLRRNLSQRSTDAAILHSDGQLSWSAFSERVAKLAAVLKTLGCESGDRVAMLAMNCGEYLEYYFAVPHAGGVFQPINTRLAGPEIEFWLNDASARILLVDASFRNQILELDSKLRHIEHIVFIGADTPPQGWHAYESLLSQAQPIPDAGRADDDLAGIFYTGGTTGRSKGVMLSHRNFLVNALAGVSGLDYGEDDVYLHAAPMFHLADGYVTIVGMLAGATHCFLPGFEPVAFMQAVQQHCVTTTVLVPTMLNMLVNHPRLGEFDLSSLKRITYGASPIPEAVIRKCWEVLPEVDLIQAYGQSECTAPCTFLPAADHRPDSPNPKRLRSGGRAVLGADVSIHDAQGQEVATGEVGEICTRGAHVMLGYWNQPELTASTIRDGWLCTGDSGYMDADGYVYLVDRVKDMIVSGGENVYSVEVENVLYQQREIAEAAVIGVPDEKFGESVHAVVRLHAGEQLSEQAIIDFCHEQIAGYKCPRSVEFREVPLPLSGAGKILKSELRAPYWEGKERSVN